jgi:F-type H+-transporting ATPase subunit delta
VKISKQARRDAKTLFRSCKVNGLLEDTRVRQTVQAVIAQKPRGYVSILSHFQHLVKIDLERRSARIESAVALTSAMESALRASLAQKYGAGLNITLAQNAMLLGGLRVKVGSDVYDGSVLARLNSLSESL